MQVRLTETIGIDRHKSFGLKFQVAFQVNYKSLECSNLKTCFLDNAHALKNNHNLLHFNQLLNIEKHFRKPGKSVFSFQLGNFTRNSPEIHKQVLQLLFLHFTSKQITGANQRAWGEVIQAYIIMYLQIDISNRLNKQSYFTKGSRYKNDQRTIIHFVIKIINL